MSRSDVIINMRGLHSVEVSDDRATIDVGGGALNDEFVDAAYDAGVQVRKFDCFSATGYHHHHGTLKSGAEVSQSTADATVLVSSVPRWEAVSHAS